MEKKRTKVHYARDIARFTEEDSKFIRSLPDMGVGVKVGLIAITALHPMGSVAQTIINRMHGKTTTKAEEKEPKLKKRGEVIYDGKFGDIPHQVAGAVENIVALGVSGLSVRANAEARMLTEAVAARDHAYEKALSQAPNLSTFWPKPILYGVAVVSTESHDEDTILRNTERAAKAGFEGMVAPGRMILPIKKNFPDMLTLNVWIRPAWADWIKDEERRTITHLESAAYGADIMAIGRTISNMKGGLPALKRVLYELELG